MNNLKPTKMLFQQPKVGSRVGAVLASDDDVVRFLGYGTRVEDSEVPPDVPGHLAESARAGEHSVPRILLDSGTHVWGVECFWAPAESVQKWIGERRVVHVSPKRQ